MTNTQGQAASQVWAEGVQRVGGASDGGRAFLLQRYGLGSPEVGQHVCSPRFGDCV